MSEPPACFPERGFVLPIIEEEEISFIAPASLDERLSAGWRHFGPRFFRYNFAIQDDALCGVLALRIPLEEFTPSKSQRRILLRNADTETRVIPTRHCAEYDALFATHRMRFKTDVPDSLRDFLPANPSEEPCQNFAIEVRVDGRLAGVSFMDVGACSASSVYAMFDPIYSNRSPGLLTLLLEIEEARRRGLKFLYVGYAYTMPSVYDYKKRFRGIEALDWGRGWIPLPQDFVWFRRRVSS